MNSLIKIKDLEIPLKIKEYKNAKTMKMFFRDGVLTVTKSPYIAKYHLDTFIKSNEQYIYEEYKKIMEGNKQKEEIWKTGEKVLYEGNEYNVKVLYHEKNSISLKLEKNIKEFVITLPNFIKKEEIDYNVKNAIKQLFKNNTEAILCKRLPYWSEKTGIKYTSYQVRDAKTKYGSCMPQTKALHFSSRLVMLKSEAIDAVIVHELCHIVHANHSKNFYNLVESFMSNYPELDKYLKNVSGMVQKF